MKRVLVDTSVIIDFLRRKNKEDSIFYQLFSKEENKPVIALVTISELWAGKGMELRGTAAKVNRLIGNIEVLVPDLAVAKMTGKILRQVDYTIAFQDAQIAAFAKREKLSVLTLNQKDFRKVKGLKLL